MTRILIAPNKTNAKHLAEVVAEMQVLGTPTIRAYWDGEKYWAVEGSHRIAAANQLGLTPIIVEVDEDDIIDDSDIEDAASNSVRDILDYLSDGKPDADNYYNIEQ